MIKEEIIKKIENRDAHIGVIGLGYVGLPLAVEFAHKGFRATGFEVDNGKVEAIMRGESYIGDVQSSAVKELVGGGLLKATTDFDVLKECDAIIICVPTPLRKTKEPDVSYILAAAAEIKRNLRSGQIIILESTTYPGTTDEVLLPIFEEDGLKLDGDFLLAFSPERVDPGNPQFQTHNIPKVVGGVTDDSTECSVKLYSQIVNNVHAVTSARVAEAAKLLENTFRAVNIGMANEMARLCYALGIDTWEVIRAAATKPFGFMAFYPGPGIGGHCLVGDETAIVEEAGSKRIVNLETLFDEQACKNRVRRFKVAGGADVIYKPDLKALSLDTNENLPAWRDVEYLFKREYEGELITLTTSDNRTLTVTDKHPLLVEKDGRFIERWAKDLQAGDRVPVFHLPPPVAGGSGDDADNPRLDLLRAMTSEAQEKVCVRGVDFSWREHRAALRGLKISDECFRLNRLPAKLFLELESRGLLNIAHNRLRLVAGKGNSCSSLPAVIEITPALARVIGYYLAEGCTTIENSRPRVRWTFHVDEKEYVADVCEVLEQELGIKSSVSYSKINRAVHVRAGSWLFGALIETLKCGAMSTEMRLPVELFNASLTHRIELLKGILRGDGDVYLAPERHAYKHQGREYDHHNASLEVGYFSSSPQMFQQVLFMLQSLGFLPTIKRTKPHLIMKGEQLERLRGWFITGKNDKLERYLATRRRRAAQSRTFKSSGDIVTVPVKTIERQHAKRNVYSIEIDATHTFATSYGLYVHNCIPLDPHYLSWKARQHGFDSRFIGLAEEVNSRMPEHVVALVADGLNDDRKSLKGARVLILGVAYKKDVNDVRESPALSIIDRLRAKGAEVRYHDPFIPEVRFDDAHTDSTGEPLQSVALTEDELRTSDCIVIVTDHTDINYEQVTHCASLIVDTRNALDTNTRRAAQARIVRL